MAAASKPWLKTLALSDIPEGEMVPVNVENAPLIAVRRGDKVFVYEDRCPHVDYPLSVGYVEGDEIVCTWHGACFAVDTGEIRCPPADGPLFSVPSKIQNSHLFVDVSNLEN